MASINKVILVGNLGADPTTRYLPSGDAVCNFSLATSDKWKDKDTGEQKTHTEWHRISAFGKLAEICNEYLRQGSSVYVEGELRTRKWQDQAGNDKYSTEVKIHTMQMLGSRQDGDQQGGGQGQGQASRGQSRPQGNRGHQSDQRGRQGGYGRQGGQQGGQAQGGYGQQRGGQPPRGQQGQQGGRGRAPDNGFEGDGFEDSDIPF